MEKKAGRKTKAFATFEMAGYTLDLFKELIRVLAEFGDDIVFTIKSDELEIRMLDSSRVMASDIVFPKYVFEEWLSEVKSPIRISVPLDDIRYAIEDAGKEAKVKFDVDLTLKTKKEECKTVRREPDKCPKCGEPTTWNRLPAEKRKLKVYKRHIRFWYKCSCGWRGRIKQRDVKEIHYTNEVVESKFKIIVREKTTDEYHIEYVTASPEEVPVPKIRFYAKYKLLAKEFLAKLKKLSKKANIVKFSGNNEKLTLQTVTDTGSVKVGIVKGVDMLLDSEVVGEQVASFSLDNLITLLPRKSADVVILEYTEEMPLRIIWQPMVEATVSFYLAPIVA
ncbi:MAG: hypothetical protein DRP02_11885 [Candidatus Gerdarchaeota archaeon]|nr:MAG: hypothetical protein DRP02_11885 [Candidatus Gerdarchaeota archaeon]